MNRRSLFGLLLAPFVPAVNSVGKVLKEKIPFLERRIFWVQLPTVDDIRNTGPVDLNEARLQSILREFMEEEDRRFMAQQTKGKPA